MTTSSKLDLNSKTVRADVGGTAARAGVAGVLPVAASLDLVPNFGPCPLRARAGGGRQPLMGYAQRKVANTAAKLAHVSSQHLKALPSKHLSAGRSAAPLAVFDAQSWAASQPPPRSTLAAFAHRIGLGNVVSSPDVIQQAVTHPSFIQLHTQQHPDQPLPNTNASLATLGNSLLGLFATEYVNSSYPHLPTRVLKAAVSAHVGPTTCANLAREMGVTPILRWHRTVSTTLVVVSFPLLISCAVTVVHFDAERDTSC